MVMFFIFFFLVLFDSFEVLHRRHLLTLCCIFITIIFGNTRMQL